MPATSRATQPSIAAKANAKSVQRHPHPTAHWSSVVQRAQAAPETLTPTDVQTLQRSIGNRATVGLLSNQLGVQAKLKLGPASDKYEQEADRIAAQVVQQTDHTQPVQRRRDEEADRRAEPEVKQKTGFVKPSADISRQANAPTQAVQRTQVNPRNKMYYSSVLEGQRITEDNAVFTATANNLFGGGHAAIYIETLSEGDNPQPKDYKVHLTYDDKAKHTHILIKEGRLPRDEETKRRSWVKSKHNAEAALDKAEEIQKQPQKKKKYRYLGGSLTKGGMNCAKFAERILKAGGIKASAGLVFKTPAELASGKNKGYQNTLDQDMDEYRKNARDENQYERRDSGRFNPLLYVRLGNENAQDEPQLNQQNELDVQNEEVNAPVKKGPEHDWLPGAIKKDFKISQDLAAQRSNRNGTGTREPSVLPIGSHIMVISEGRNDNEVVIECINPRGYFLVNLASLYAASPQGG